MGGGELDEEKRIQTTLLDHIQYIYMCVCLIILLDINKWILKVKYHVQSLRLKVIPPASPVKRN